MVSSQKTSGCFWERHSLVNECYKCVCVCAIPGTNHKKNVTVVKKRPKRGHWWSEYVRIAIRIALHGKHKGGLKETETVAGNGSVCVNPFTARCGPIDVVACPTACCLSEKTSSSAKTYFLRSIWMRCLAPSLSMLATSMLIKLCCDGLHFFMRVSYCVTNAKGCFTGPVAIVTCPSSIFRSLFLSLTVLSIAFARWAQGRHARANVSNLLQQQQLELSNQTYQSTKSKIFHCLHVCLFF